jgi:hypothetical protein
MSLPLTQNWLTIVTPLPASSGRTISVDPSGSYMPEICTRSEPSTSHVHAPASGTQSADWLPLSVGSDTKFD